MKKVTICQSTGCVTGGSIDIYKKFAEEISNHGFKLITDSRQLANYVDRSNIIYLARSGCLGFCAEGPIVTIEPDDIFYTKINPAHVPDITAKTLKEDQVIEELLYTDPETGKKCRSMKDISFYKYQQKNVLGNAGIIDPENIGEYIEKNGYVAEEKALKHMTPEEIINIIKESGLRGRGGGGFLTGLKWEFCKNAEDNEKYIICNADEGDPGAFMDMTLLESDPHAVIEGMVIGGKAIGANKGYIYVRAEYPLAIDRLTKAIHQARELELLGEDLFETDYDFDIEIYQGAGAFVCGEETALMHSIEGKRGIPRPKPPFPANEGLWGKPTVINNVETFANVSKIIANGPEWFSRYGTETSKGTKVFALSGDVNNTGLIEIPMGMKLRDIIFNVGGGIRNGKKFKAVQIGGPSGGCLPESMIDSVIDYESLTKTGAIVGSGGMVVMDETSCMVDIAKFFLQFTADESCGKCTPCRVGTKALLKKLTDITEGRGKEGDIESLERMSRNIKASSLCGLGQTAPNPVLTTIKYFRHEYEAHIRDKKCPAHKCTALVTYAILEDKCTGCTACARKCPVDAITGAKKEVHKIDQEKCIKCGQCYSTCKFDAVFVD